MAVKSKNTYTQKEFEKDLYSLEKLISKNQKGGNNDDNEDDEDDEDNNNNDNNEYEYEGGAKKPYTGEYRHFKFAMVNGKEYKSDGRANIQDNQGPLNAARKLLLSYCKSENIKKDERTKFHITFVIQETTRGPRQGKMYGPYSGKYIKYTPEQIKAIKAAGRFSTMKADVRLHKEKVHHNKNKVHNNKGKSNQKGGAQL